MAAATPFPKAARTVVRRHPIDPSLFTIEHGTTPPEVSLAGKYDKVFDKLKPGDCVVCEPRECRATRDAMQKWARRRKKAVRIASRSACHDGKARVWMLAAE